MVIINPVFSQYLEIIDVDTSKYPVLSAKYIALNEKMELINNLTISESKILENDIPQKIIKIINPQDTNVMQSVVLVVDVSGSMSGTNIDLAKSAMKEFINLTPYTFAELSILSFDTDLYVNQDFTRNKAKLLNCVDNLRSGGGTSYNAAFLHSKNSALKLAASRKGSESVIIFLTDGLSTANFTEIAKIANENGTKVYSITLNMPMPYDLAEITNQTNAKYFENISNVDDAKRAYLSILFDVYNLYGHVFWEAERSCDEVVGFTFNTRNNMTSSYFYEVSPQKTKGIFFENQIIAFDPYVTENAKNQTIGANSNSNITKILLSDSVNYSISYDFSLPVEIKTDKNLTITINKPLSEKNIFCEVQVETDICPPKKFYIFQGNIADFIIPGSLLVLTPNGGETFIAGNYTYIKWKNKTNTRFVNIYYSDNNGLNYTWLKQTSETELNWLIPGVTSDSCLIKVDLQTEPMLLNQSYSNSQKLEVSNSGNLLIRTQSKSLLYSSISENKIIKSVYLKKSIKDFEKSPISDNIVLQSANKLFIFDYSRYKIVKLNHQKDNILDYFYTSDGKSIVVFYKNKSSFLEFDAKTGKQKKKHKVGSPIKEATNNKSLVSIITADKKWIIWDIKQGRKIYEAESKVGYSHSDINFSGEYAAAIDKKNIISYWSKKENDTILCVDFSAYPHPTEIKFNPYNNTLLCSEKDKSFALLNVNEVIYEYKPPRGIYLNKVDFNPNGKELIFGISNKNNRVDDIYRYNIKQQMLAKSNNNLKFNEVVTNFSFNNSGNVGVFKTSTGYSVYLFTNENNSTNDVSDNVFSVKSFSPQIKDTIYLPPTFVGTSITYIDSTIFYNPNDNSAIVDDIDFSGEHAGKFSIISGFPPFGIVSKKHRGFEIAFKSANQPGVYTTDLLAYSGLDTLHSVVKVNVIKPPVNETSISVDLGTVNMDKSLEKSFSLFENITDTTLTIQKIECWGPDKTQIKLKNTYTNYKLKSKEKINFDFSFVGKNRGYTNSVYLIYVKGIHEPLRLNVSGKVYAAERITVKCMVVNLLDNSPVRTDVSYYNSANNQLIRTMKTDAKGEATVIVPNELSYRFEAVSLNSSSAIVDLTNVFRDTIIQIKLSVMHIEDGMKYNLQNANFEIGSANLNSEAKLELNKLAKLMIDYPNITIQVDGHTDNEGTPVFNQDLSEKRANSVKTYLVSNGIEKKRINTTGYGLSKPVGTNETEEGKAKNRRIEITIKTK